MRQREKAQEDAPPRIESNSRYVMLIWAPLIPATRWSYSQQSLLAAVGRLQLHLVAGVKGAQIIITNVM